MAIQINSYDGTSPAADPAGNAPEITRIADYIIIDTVLAGISGDGGSSTIDLTELLSGAHAVQPVTYSKLESESVASSGPDAISYLEISRGRNVRILSSLPAGVTLQSTFQPWSAAQIGVLDDEVFYIVYNGPKVKNNKIFPYAGYKMTDSGDKIYVELNNTTDTAKFFW